MVNIAMIMVVLRCVSRSIVLDSRLCSSSRCTLTAGRKQNPQKVESTPPPHDHKTAAAQIFLDHGRFVRNTPKTEQNRSRTNYIRILKTDLQLSPASRQPQPIPPQNASRRQPFIFRRIQSQKGGYFKAVTIPKTLHQIAQYSAQYFMQYFTVYFSICSCILSCVNFSSSHPLLYVIVFLTISVTHIP